MHQAQSVTTKSYDNQVLQDMYKVLLAALRRAMNSGSYTVEMQRLDAHDLVQDVLLVLLIRLPDQFNKPNWPLLVVVAKRLALKQARLLRNAGYRQAEYVELMSGVQPSHDRRLHRFVVRHDLRCTRNRLRGAYRRLLTACLSGNIPDAVVDHPSRAATKRLFGVDVVVLKKLLAKNVEV